MNFGRPIHPSARHERKEITIKIATLKKSGKDAADEISKGRAIDASATDAERKVAEHEEKTHSLLMRLPNLLHDSVSTGKDENENQEVRVWGRTPKFGFTPKGHIELGIDLGILDMERAGKVAGARED